MSSPTMMHDILNKEKKTDKILGHLRNRNVYTSFRVFGAATRLKNKHS
jgi:hypothetical protein